MSRQNNGGWLRPGVPIRLDPAHGFRPMPHTASVQPPSGDLHINVQLGGEALKADERGLIMHGAINVDPARNAIYTTGGPIFDDGEIRTAALFWDRIDIPQNGFIGLGHPDLGFLEKAGVVTPSLAVPAGMFEVARAIVKGVERTFEERDKRDPGCWAVSVGHNRINLIKPSSEPDRGLIFKLMNVLPVPAEDAPLGEILEFKQRRRPELLALRTELERVYQGILAAPDRPLAELTEARALDKVATDALKAAAESRFPFKFSDWQVSMNVGKAVAVGTAAAAAAPYVGLPHLAAAFGGAAGALGLFDLKRSVGWRPKTGAGPYAYLVNYNKEFVRR